MRGGGKIIEMGTRTGEKQDADADEDEGDGTDHVWEPGWEEDGYYTLFAAFVEFSMLVRRREMGCSSRLRSKVSKEFSRQVNFRSSSSIQKCMRYPLSGCDKYCASDDVI
jgi:hypothetical protein